MKYLWPALIVGAALVLAVVLTVLRPAPEVSPPEPYIPLVRYTVAEPERVPLVVHAQGTVQPRTETLLTAEVGGRIQRVPEVFENGGFFNEGDVLLEIDPLTHETALAEARATLAAARLTLANEEAEAQHAQQEWEVHGEGGPDATDLALRLPQLEKARADVAAAEARVGTAERNLERTQVRAPYDGRIREKQVDVGHVVAANTTALASIYAIDFAEIRLPLSMNEAALLGAASTSGDHAQPIMPARITAGTGNGTHRWLGSVVRNEGVIDPRSRMITVIARVDDPYRRRATLPGPPLMIGQFVEAEIDGMTLEHAFRIPRRSLVDRASVRVIGPDDRLTTRTVTVHWTTETHAILIDGLEDGERVSTSPIDLFVEGMRVNPQPLEASTP